MDQIPGVVHVGNLVGREFDHIHRNGDGENDWVCHQLKAGRKLNNAKTVQETQRRDRRIQV